MARAILKGVPLSPGIAIGPLRLFPDARNHDRRNITEGEISQEIAALKEASAIACANLTRTINSIPDNLAEYKEIVALQRELARDPRILNGAIARIRHKKICAGWALSETISELANLFQGMADPYLSDRAQDIRSIGQHLIVALNGSASGIETGVPGILAAYDLSPANIMESSPEEILGLITVEGGASSHTAILARGLKAPAVGGVNGLFSNAQENDIVILDGITGEVLIDPDEEEIVHYEKARETCQAFENEARRSAQEAAITRDGIQITVLANLENQQEMHELLRCGASGVGLFRTEYGWLKHNGPDEETLFQEYGSILRKAGGKKVIFRTLDVGADKALPVHEALHEPNPALGLRGIRFCLAHKEIFRPQLRALMRAGVFGNMALMLPMISAVFEIRQFHELVREVDEELKREGLEHVARPETGAMIETPAAVLICSELARECDFLSLGTNDLLHYIMAIDRNNRHVTYLHEPLHPAFVRAIKNVVDSCHEQGKKISVCGELAADPLGLALLVGLGVDIFSATPRFVPAIKNILRKLDSGACREIAQAALNGADVNETRDKLRKSLVECMKPDI